MARGDWPQIDLRRLREGDVRSGDYPTWALTLEEIVERERAILDPLLESMQTEGQLHPVTIAVLSGGALFLSDGHHRAVAASLLGWTALSYRWYRSPHRTRRPSFNYTPLPGGKR
jgi:hypothetical protein